MSAIIAGSATAFTAMLYDNRSMSTIKTDYQLTQQLKRSIAEAPDLASSHIQAKSIDHNLLIFGQVPSYIERKHVQSMAENLPHVKKIYNQLTIDTPASSWEQTKDTWMTAKIKSALLKTPELRSMQISVSTSKGTAYLMGMLPRKQAEMAAKVASDVSGVKRVVRLLLPVV